MIIKSKIPSLYDSNIIEKCRFNFLQKRWNDMNSTFLKLCIYLQDGIEGNMFCPIDNEDCYYDHWKSDVFVV